MDTQLTIGFFPAKNLAKRVGIERHVALKPPLAIGGAQELVEQRRRDPRLQDQPPAEACSTDV
eukprot:gene6113-gene6704